MLCAECCHQCFMLQKQISLCMCRIKKIDLNVKLKREKFFFIWAQKKDD